MEIGAKALKTYRKVRDAGRIPVLDSDTLAYLDIQTTPQPVLESNTGA